MSKIEEILERLRILEKEIPRQWHNFRSQMCAESRKMKKKKKEKVIF